MNYEQIILELRPPVAILTLNRPDVRNAISEQAMIDELCEAVNKVDRDENIRVMILTGAPPAFSSGGNIKDMAAKMGMFAGNPDQVAEAYRQGIQRIPRAMSGIYVPVIAAVNGPAIGAGCDLTCMCDVRLASTRARFGETFGAIGLVPGDGGAYFLPRVVGLAKAAELTYTCRVIDAAEALRIGLVSEVVEPDELMPRALEVAAEIARQPRRTLRMSKRLLRLAQSKSLLEVLDLSATFQGACHQMPEHKAALERMLKKIK